MKTAENIIMDMLHAKTDLGQFHSQETAKAVISDLKHNGYIVVDAGILTKNISSAMTGGGAFIE